jgi:hypothetical protein
LFYLSIYEGHTVSQDRTNSADEDIRKLDSRDKVGVAGEILAALGGVAGGTAAAGTLAAAVGVTTIPVLTTAASWFGIAVFSATPVGWIAGVGLAGGLIAFGVGKIIRSGGMQDQIRKDLMERLRERIIARHVDAPAVLDPKALSSIINDAVKQGSIDQVMADRIVSVVTNGKLDPALAIQRVEAIMASSAEPRVQRKPLKKPKTPMQGLRQPR